MNLKEVQYIVDVKVIQSVWYRALRLTTVQCGTVAMAHLVCLDGHQTRSSEHTASPLSPTTTHRHFGEGSGRAIQSSGNSKSNWRDSRIQLVQCVQLTTFVVYAACGNFAPQLMKLDRRRKEIPYRTYLHWPTVDNVYRAPWTRFGAFMGFWCDVGLDSLLTDVSVGSQTQ